MSDLIINFVVCSEDELEVLDEHGFYMGCIVLIDEWVFHPKEEADDIYQDQLEAITEKVKALNKELNNEQ